MSIKSLLLYVYFALNPLPKEESLIIKCEKNMHVKSEDLKIKITYYNKSNDTIVLPIKYLVYTNFQEVQFISDKNIFCTRSTKMVWPLENNDSKCNFQNLKADEFKIIEPHKKTCLEFKLDDLGCVGYNFSKGEKVFYSINLNIDVRFKRWCDKVWTGNIMSDTGSFIIE